MFGATCRTPEGQLHPCGVRPPVCSHITFPPSYPQLNKNYGGERFECRGVGGSAGRPSTGITSWFPAPTYGTMRRLAHAGALDS